MPDAIGSWPAFWTRSGWPPEIDIMECPFNYDQRWLYWWNYHYGPDWQNHWSYGSEVWLGSDLTTGFHTYAVDGDNFYLRFRFDDAQKGQSPTPPPSATSPNRTTSSSTMPSRLARDRPPHYPTDTSATGSASGGGTKTPRWK